MTKFHNRFQDDEYAFQIDFRSGGNTPKPHKGFGGFFRENTRLERKILNTRFHNEHGSPGLAFQPYPKIGYQSSGTRHWLFYDHPEMPIDLGFGVDLALRAKIAQTDFNALVTAMEMKSTIVGIGSLANRLGNAYRALRHGDLRGFTRALDVSQRGPRNVSPKKVMDNASSYLLEYQFGIVPLYSDMLGLATTLYDQSQFPSRIKVKSTEVRPIEGNMKARLTPTYKWTDGNTRTHGTIETQGSYSGTAIYKAVTEVVVDSPLEFYLSQFGFTNPVHAAYSVLPNSWLFDAFVPLGDFLSQLYLPPGVSLENSGVVRLMDTEITFPGKTLESDETYMYPFLNEEGLVRQGAIKASHVVPGMKGQVFRLWMDAADFSNVSIQIKPKLPFLGQAITSAAYAHQRSDDLKKLLRGNSRR